MLTFTGLTCQSPLWKAEKEKALLRPASYRRWLEVGTNVFPHLVVPIGPFVAAFRAPVVQVMSYARVPEHFGHSIGRAGHFPRAGAGGEVNVATRELVARPG